MLVLDTNVLSAIMSREPAPEVAAWVAAQPEETLCTAAVCQAKILAGIEIMPAGPRRSALASAARAIFADDFDGRILPFDGAAAPLHGELFAARHRAGRPTATADLMIAAIARANDAGVATRNTGDFAECGLTLINPWETC